MNLIYFAVPVAALFSLIQLKPPGCYMKTYNFYEGYYSEAEKVSGRKFHVAWA